MAAAEADWALLPDDIIRDIFARLRTNEPLYIFRVSHLCKDWLRALSDPDFARRLRAHGVPPLLLGFFHDLHDGRLPTFLHTAAVPSPFSRLEDVPDRRDWKVLDYRHGRALFLSTGDGELGRKELLVWDPITRVQRRVPVAPQASEIGYPGAAVLCAVPGCSHFPGCDGGDFQVALVFHYPPFHLLDDEDYEDEPQRVRCFLYSSQTDTWTDAASFYGTDFFEDFGERPSVLAGKSLYFLSNGYASFEFDMCANTLSHIPLPDMIHLEWMYFQYTILLVLAEHGGIGLVGAADGNIFIWSRDISVGDGWSLTDVFDHSDLAPKFGIDNPSLLGFAQGSSAIFVRTPQGIFTFELPSGLDERVLEKRKLFNCVFPVVSFYAPAPLNGLQKIDAEQHHDQPNPNEDDGDGGIKVENTLQEAEHLFTQGCNDMENRDFNSAVQCLRHCLEIRTGHYGKFAPECASTYYKYGCALLYKAKEETYLAGEGYGNLGLSLEMLDTARLIVEMNPDNSMGIADVVSALAEVQREMEEAAVTFFAEAQTESIKRANVMPTSAEPSGKRHQKAADPVAIDRSSHDSAMQSSTV